MVEERVERRLAVILAADVAGYSRLMDVDEEATLRTLMAHRRIIDGLVSGYGGRVFGSARRQRDCRVLQPSRGGALRRRHSAESRTEQYRPAGRSADALSNRHQPGATSWSRAMTCSATASTWRRDWRAWPMPAAFASAERSTIRSRARLRKRSTSWASKRLRTSRVRFAPTAFQSTRQRRWPLTRHTLHRRWSSRRPTGPPSRSSRSRVWRVTLTKTTSPTGSGSGFRRR